MFVKATAVEADTPEGIQKEMAAVFTEMDRSMREWTMRAARGECAWVCADCCGVDNSGMPDECLHGQQWCTDINQRDKRNARAEVK